MDKTEIIMDRVAQRMVNMAQERGANKSLCPSEVAQSVVNKESEWRRLMPVVREVACMLSNRGIIQIEQSDNLISVNDPSEIEGPIRIRIHPNQLN